MTTPRQKYTEAIESLERSVKEGRVNQEEFDAIKELCQAYDEENMQVSLPSDGEYAEDTKHKQPNTLRYWAVYLKRISERANFELTEATADDINSLMTELRSGDHPDVKDGGLSNNSIRNYQAVARRFYRYHDIDVDTEEITLITSDESHVDERDMLTKEEIDDIRNAADHPRDLAIFDLLLYTGQRNTAIRSLRIKDIDLDEAVYYLNTEADGLKGADETGKKRPLLGAVGSLREWMRYHPNPDDPDAYLITAKPRYRNTDGSDMVSRNTLRYSMEQLKEKAGIEKPMNPHNIRHNFVTICKRDYGLSDATVKWLIGHRPDSQVMETTYAHLSDEDYIRAAEEGAGVREPEEESSLSPDICHCGEPLPDNAKACPRCGMVYTPDAQQVQASVQQDIGAEKALAELEESGDLTTEQIDALAGDDALMARLIEARAERTSQS